MKALLLCIATFEVCMAGQPPASCRLEVAAGHGQPVVFGKEVRVPDLNILIVDRATGQPVTPKTIDVFYVWDWFEYPATEHPVGAWEQAHEIVRCEGFEGGDITLPAYTVRPRGWYKGRYAQWPWPKRPSFKHLEISVYLPQCAVPRVKIEPKALKQYEKGQATWRVSCDKLVEISFQAKPR